MKLHRKPLLGYLRGNGGRSPDQEGTLLKKGYRNPTYQRRWFVLWGNILYYLERQGDQSPLGLILLENCQVEPRPEANVPFAFTISFPTAEDGRAYKLAAESEADLGGWLRALGGAGWGLLLRLLSPLEAQYRDVCARAGLEPRAPPRDEEGGPFPSRPPVPSGFQELHQRFGEEIRALRGRLAQGQGRLLDFG
ncbi:sesquipedalian-1-like [Ornithorhynchus anatinus]|uniref:sesquipedalian-1-like n=1 Tax=Ornithorhynchus anatinus TaxID=9258 RepID=UPI0001555DB7|nr:sesquipedalian-1-like [Ornithorhynchus anatinus]